MKAVRSYDFFPEQRYVDFNKKIFTLETQQGLYDLRYILFCLCRKVETDDAQRPSAQAGPKESERDKSLKSVLVASISTFSISPNKKYVCILYHSLKRLVKVDKEFYILNLFNIESMKTTSLL